MVTGRPGAGRGEALLALLLLVGCAAVDRGPQLEIPAGNGLTLRGPLGALTSDRLLLDYHASRNCISTADGRFGCWGRATRRFTTEGLTGLPTSAWIGCIAAREETREPSACAIVRAPGSPALQIRSLDRSPHGVCVVRENGRVRCGPKLDDARDVRGVRNAVQVVVGPDGRCARLRDGGVVCWDRDSGIWRVAISDVVDLAAAQLADRNCAVLRGGRVACWQNYERTAPQIVEGVHDAIEVELGGVAELGEAMDCARLASGGVACWDAGAGTAARRIAGAEQIVELQLADGFACARDRADGVWCWGENAASCSEIASPRRF